ncbi:uncharacterized protein LOC129919272 [Episyrphus balteatus]|uniref:uncharacterized protein LOC129919272 n=1 Tax=Episyrphus balteatus TaxID=286459 RepID=UPI00248659EC|nr:uncharacterized protein LOC129919272 [Episyrphus balteatus]
MEVLKQARGHYKGAITRVFTYVQNIPENVNVLELRVRLDRLEKAFKDICDSQSALFEFHAEEGYVDPEPEFEILESKYISSKCALLKRIKDINPVDEIDKPDALKELAASQAELLDRLGQVASSNNGDKNPTNIKLQPMQIPPFSGDYREWPGFRDVFLQTVDCNTKLSSSQKFRYLKSVLREDAFNLLNGVSVSDSNYQLAWEKLENRYDKPLYIINALIEQFLKLPNVVSGDGFHLRKLVDKADEVIRGLEAVKSEGRDPWLVYLLINKTDSETKKAWALENKMSEESTIKDLIHFLENRSNALEASDPKTSRVKNSRASNPTNIKSLAVVNTSCPKCKGEHYLPQCPEFVSMSVSSRRGFARDQRLCYNCLGTKHSSNRCRVKARCKLCKSRHHSLVHLDNINPAASASVVDPTQNSASVVSNHMKNDSRSSVILPTAVVKVFDNSGKTHLVRVLLDSGSQVSFVTDSLVKRLGLRRSHARLPISGISSVEAGVTQGAVELQLKSRITPHTMQVEAYILNQITSQTPSLSFEASNFTFLDDLLLADVGFKNPGPIDVLLGADKAWSILLSDHRSDPEGKVVAHETLFGWVVTGCLPGNSLVSLHAGVDLDVILKSFWEIEEVSHSSSLTVGEDEVDKQFSKTLTRSSDKKYVVELPFRQDNVKFANTISGALSRLFAMERRFCRDKDLKREYCKFMQTYLDLGHMERIPDNEIEPTSGSVFYLPHHAVITNKIRVVFDGSHKDTKNSCLNDMLHVGTPLQRNLINVCIRFRVHRFVFCADIVKMFRQIWVHPKHRDFQRIVWRESSDAPISHFRLSTVTYGTSPAPYLSMKVLRQIAFDYKHQFPLASHAVLNDMYVDDLMTGADSLSETLELKKQIVEMLSCGGLELSKWSSNCWEILREINCKEAVSLDLDSSSECTKVLGLVWNPYRDTFTYKISLPEQFVPTKRKLLSEVAKIFDPLGFLAPSTILLKILFQELWTAKTKIDWDDPLPSEIAEKWKLHRENLTYFENFRISRRFTQNSKSLELIGFSDASEKAYSAVVYCRSCSGDGAEIQLVAAKTRVAPVKQLSIPRLELCGALLLCRLIELIRSSLDVKPVRVSAFCDSQIVLSWLSSPPRKWNTFVANRTSEILSSLPRSSWNHVSSSDNPADCASRGLLPKDLMDYKMWWNGPEWLSQDFDKWPNHREIEVKDIPEERKKVVAVCVSGTVEHFLENLSLKISSWRKLVRIVGYIRRFIYFCRLPKGDRRYGYLSLSELRLAKKACLKWSQNEFLGEIKALKADRCVDKMSKLCSLSPFIDVVGLLRVGGRISNARNVPFAIKHPVILPKNNPITRLILLDAHRNLLHIGVSGLFTLIRQEYWILGSRNLIRKLVHDCITCFRHRKNTSTQLMGNLPSSRVNPSFAFAHTGCDYAGPITLRSSRGRKPTMSKGYISLFVCMTTKALHLELVSDLTTDAFLAALKRFIARRGKCSVMYSDNGTNFQGAARVLSEMYKLVQSQTHNKKVAEMLAGENIDWQFIPPHSPHFGGLWEAGVKLVKQHLRRVVGDSVLTFEEMCTLLAQIEALLNSRPLCASSDSDLDPLTPSHFLIGRPYTAIPEPSFLETPINRLGRWELLQNMMQGFWRRWQTDYLTSLQQRPKWREAKRDFEVGDLVILKEPNLPPSQWFLGRVTEVHPGEDGHVRVVTLRTKRGTFMRPVTKLALLPCPEIPSAGAAC